MSEADKDLARERAARAARQAKHAAQNVAGAAEHEKDHIADSINRAAEPLNPRGLMTVMGDVSTGFIAVTGAVILSFTAAQRFRAAYAARGRMVK